MASDKARTTGAYKAATALIRLPTAFGLGEFAAQTAASTRFGRDLGLSFGDVLKGNYERPHIRR